MANPTDNTPTFIDAATNPPPRTSESLIVCPVDIEGHEHQLRVDERARLASPAVLKSEDA